MPYKPGDPLPPWFRSSEPLHVIYMNLREAGSELEQFIGDHTEDKELDKAATVLKVAFKMIKKRARKMQHANTG